MARIFKSVENKKGGVNSTFFAPNLTMNLTYLCYGESKVRGPIGGTRKRRWSAIFFDEVFNASDKWLIGSSVVAFEIVDKGAVYNATSAMSRVITGEVPVA